MKVSGHRFALVAVAAVIALAGAACSSDDESADTTTSTTAADESSEEVLTILVGNDDGVEAPGIAALADALAAMPDTEVVVAAPADEKSGSGGKTTDGELSTTDTETDTGFPATAVDGFPADAIAWALDGGIDVTPDLVVTGINTGQNLGSIGDQVSGTIGAARVAVREGIPALATSMGISDDADYELAATYVVDWVEEHRSQLLAGELSGDAVILENMNVPHCTSGEIRGVVDVPMSTVNDGALEPSQDCESTLEDPADDIAAFNNGFVSLSAISFEPAATTG